MSKRGKIDFLENDFICRKKYRFLDWSGSSTISLSHLHYDEELEKRERQRRERGEPADY